MFIFSKFFSWFFLPPGIFIIMIFVSVVLILKNKKRIAIILLIISSITLYLFSITPVKNMFFLPLEYSYDFPDISNINADAIIILSGGSIGPAPDNNMKNSLNKESFRRTYMGYKLWKEKRVPIITTGGTLFGSHEPESLTTKLTLIEMGVDEKYIYSENKSRNTIKNAIYAKEIVIKNGFNKICLVTSAYHMKRSVYIFKKLNINVIPVPTDYHSITRKYSIAYFMPNIGNLYDSCIVIHEYIGILYSKIMLSNKH